MSRVPQSAPVFPDNSVQNVSQSPFFELNAQDRTHNNLSQTSQK